MNTICILKETFSKRTLWHFKNKGNFERHVDVGDQMLVILLTFKSTKTKHTDDDVKKTNLVK